MQDNIAIISLEDNHLQVNNSQKGEIFLGRYNTVLYNWTDVTNRLLHDKQLLAHFLRFSAGMYKQLFSDAALIYQQNPYATKVAPLEVWNKIGNPRAAFRRKDHAEKLHLLKG